VTTFIHAIGGHSAGVLQWTLPIILGYFIFIRCLFQYDIIEEVLKYDNVLLLLEIKIRVLGYYFPSIQKTTNLKCFKYSL
jgi:hypothetical protein